MATQGASEVTALDLLRFTDGLVVHQALFAAANLGVADLLKEGARSAADLAASLHVNADALYRTMRFLAGQGVFYETAARTFVNSPLSEWLRADVAGSIRSILIYRGGPNYYGPFAELLSSIKTGAPVREKTGAASVFEHLQQNPRDACIFDDAMTDLSMIWGASVAGAYDFGRWGSLMDIGGGSGLLLATILKAHLGLRGVLVDRPDVLERARQREFWSSDIAGRARFEPADFFQSVPSGCRAYLMKNVIHDWDDERARRILMNCRRAISDDGVLLVVEYCLGDDNRPTMGKTIDMLMLTLTGGRERTLAEHGALLASAGFRMERSIPVTDEVTILEARPVTEEGNRLGD
jgi:O-methyltransferase domain/Dimerisation domain